MLGSASQQALYRAAAGANHITPSQGTLAMVARAQDRAAHAQDTSMACPHVSGYRGHRPSARYSTITARLNNSTQASEFRWSTTHVDMVRLLPSYLALAKKP